MAGTRRFRNWFFQISNVLRADGTMGGVRLLKTDKPTRATMEDLAESITFKKESLDRAKIYTGSSDLDTEQGLAVLATDAQAKDNTAQLSDRSLVVQPSQLPTSENEDAAALEDMPVRTMDIADDGTTTRNNYKFKINLPWLTWLVSRIFKQDGVEGDVPIKASSTHYDWTWGNLANNSTFINSLLANDTFIDNLTTTIINNNPLAITDALPVSTVMLQTVNPNILGAKWLAAQGQILLIANYPDLAALYSANLPGPGVNFYGGNGTTTFALPDYRGREIRNENGDFGAIGGDNFHTISLNNLPSLNITGSTTGTGTTDIGATNTDGVHEHYISITSTDPTPDIDAYRLDGLTGLIGAGVGAIDTPGPNRWKANTQLSAHSHTIPPLTVSSGISLTGSVTGVGLNDDFDTKDKFIVQAYYIKVK